MKKINIKLSTIDDVKNFVNAVTLFNGEADLTSGRYVVDAKSIMGIFSLDLAHEITLSLNGVDEDKFVDSIKQFIVE